MMPSTIVKSLLEEVKEHAKVIPLTEQMQHMPEDKKVLMLLPTYFPDLRA